MFLRAAAFRADAFAARFLGGEVGGAAPEPEAQRPTGGWNFPPEYGRRQTDEERREERERLGIIPKQQKGLDRAARAIAKRVDPGRSPEEIAAEVAKAKEFDKIMADLTARNRQVIEGYALMVMQAIQARILEELRDEDDAIAMLLLEM